MPQIEPQSASGRVALVAEFPPPAAGMTVQAAMLRDRLQAAGYAVAPVRTNTPLPDWLERLRFVRGLVKWLCFAWQCRRLAGAEIVHVFACSGLSFVLFAVPPVWVGRLLGRRVVVHYHGGAAGAFAERYPWLLGRTLAAADRLVVPSGFLQQVFAGLGHQAEVVGNPTDLEAFHFRPRPEGDPVVLSCRNLEPVYDVATGLRAFAYMHRHMPGARFLIAGDGRQRQELESLTAALDIGPAVSFLGNVPSTRMPDLLAQAHILINSSRADNLPGSILEAFAAGVPVVSTAAGGIPWLVQDEESGLLAPVGDARRLGEQLLRLARDQTLATGLAARGHAIAAGYRWSEIEPLWRAIYAGARSRRAA